MFFGDDIIMANNNYINERINMNNKKENNNNQSQTIIKEVYVSYNKDGDLERKDYLPNKSIYKIKNKSLIDLICFSLFGKTIYKEIISIRKGVPFINIHLNYDDTDIYVSREPEYISITHFKNKVLNKELFALKIDDKEYKSLTEKEFHKLLDKYVDFSFEDILKI